MKKGVLFGLLLASSLSFSDIVIVKGTNISSNYIDIDYATNSYICVTNGYILPMEIYSNFSIAERKVTYSNAFYIVTYEYNKSYASIPATMPQGQPHYAATITVSEVVDGVKARVCEPFSGSYTENGCFEDDPKMLVEKALAIRGHFYPKTFQSVIERHYVYSNKTYAILYDEYSTNSLPYIIVPGTNSVGLIRFRNAVITIYEIVGGLSNRVSTPFRGISIKNTIDWDEATDKFYVIKALSYSEP